MKNDRMADDRKASGKRREYGYLDDAESRRKAHASKHGSSLRAHRKGHRKASYFDYSNMDFSVDND